MRFQAAYKFVYYILWLSSCELRYSTITATLQLDYEPLNKKRMTAMDNKSPFNHKLKTKYA